MAGGTGIGSWLRGRVIRWLASGGHDGVRLVVNGAQHVTVEAARQVTVSGGVVVARNCRVLQDSTGEKIYSEAERTQAAGGQQISPETAKQRIMRENLHNAGNAARDNSRLRAEAPAGWNRHNAGSLEDES